MSPEEQRQQYLVAAGTFLTQRVGTPMTLEATQQLIDEGALYHNGGGWVLDTASSALLFVPGCAGLVSSSALQTSLANLPAARAELQRRQLAILAPLENDWLNQSTPDPLDGFSVTELAQLDGFVASSAKAREETAARIAAAQAPTPSAIAAKKEVGSNITDLFAGIQTDFQRNGFPPDAA